MPALGWVCTAGGVHIQHCRFWYISGMKLTDPAWGSGTYSFECNSGAILGMKRFLSFGVLVF